MRTVFFRQWVMVVLIGIVGLGCSTERVKNRAKETAQRYWAEKAYPGKAYDVQVIEAEKAENGMWRVKGVVDGETRSGLFNPETESFNEGLYGLSQERGRKIAELEQEVKYWKEKAEGLEKELFKYKVRMRVKEGKKVEDEATEEKKGE